MTLPNCYRCGNQPCTCGATLYLGDCLDVLKQLPSGSVHSVVTSPPYFALRSYLPKDHPDKGKEIGSEPTPEAFIATMVEVFREVRRVLRDDGVCWVNLGDGYDCGTNKPQVGSPTTDVGNWQGCVVAKTMRRKTGLQAGNLLNIPHRVAEALRQDGWIWRQTIVWSKRSPMPESVSGWRWMRCRVRGERLRNNAGLHRDDADVSPVTSKPWAEWQPCPGCPKCEPNGGYVLRRGSGRCTTAHEYVFLLTKTNKYFWDSEASKEQTTQPERSGKVEKTFSTSDPEGSLRCDTGREVLRTGYRNPRSVWTLSSEPTKVRHFATFPSELVRRCLASAPSKVCPTCGAPWAPVVDSERIENPGHKWGPRGDFHVDPGTRSGVGYDKSELIVSRCSGYRQTCSCPSHKPTGGLVLDPFCGIGTTGQTARQLGMRFIGIDLNSEYLDHAKVRIAEKPRWWIRKNKPKKTPKPLPEQGVLFS